MFVTIQESSSTNDAGSRGFYRASGILLHAEAVWLFLLSDAGRHYGCMKSCRQTSVSKGGAEADNEV